MQRSHWPYETVLNYLPDDPIMDTVMFEQQIIFLFHLHMHCHLNSSLSVLSLIISQDYIPL